MDSTALSSILRVVLGVLGGLLFLGGLLVASVGGTAAGGAAAAAAFWPIVIGIGLIVVALYERGRYRAAHGPSAGAKGPAGGPATSSAERFERTDEVFTDPTSGQLTRVWFDPTTG
ncbi:MAG TPA: hypothetical protein VFW92_07420, partial [Candidatus Limnocylindrales bacterium]|nr:hypothetical protein [Candidatus Limnocylindrales bacterium]